LPRRKTGIADALALDRGDRFELTLGEFGGDGEILATVEGVPAAVHGGLPGERVTVEVVRKYHDSLACRVVDVLDPSPDRRDPPCRYYGGCTGCQLQHVQYGRQLQIKRARVLDALRAYPALAGTSVLPTLPSPMQLRYRNHARFTVGRLGEVGFVNRHSRGFNRIDECLLMQDPINDVLARVQARLKGMTQFSVRASTATGDRLVQPRLIDSGCGVDSGGSTYWEQIGDRRFRVAGSSFFQVNTAVARQLIDRVKAALALDGTQIVIDAYAGVGVFAAMLASSSKRVIGIEDSASAVDDARANTADLPNVEFVMGRTEALLPTMREADAVAMDPPRSGCQPVAIEALRALGPARVAMVSCEPDALARDLDLLCRDQLFAVEWIQPADMFPQTYHIECVASVVRSSARANGRA